METSPLPSERAVQYSRSVNGHGESQKIIAAADYQFIKRAGAEAWRRAAGGAVDQGAKSVYVAARNLFLASPC